jgi:hypothetical protein
MLKNFYTLCQMVCYNKLNIPHFYVTSSSFTCHKQSAKGFSKNDGYFYYNFKVNKEHSITVMFTSMHELGEGGCLKGDDKNMEK